MMESLLRDLRFGMRVLTRKPGITIMSVASMTSAPTVVRLGPTASIHGTESRLTLT